MRGQYGLILIAYIAAASTSGRIATNSEEMNKATTAKIVVFFKSLLPIYLIKISWRAIKDFWKQSIEENSTWLARLAFNFVGIPSADRS
jgi:hypothetical protein